MLKVPGEIVHLTGIYEVIHLGHRGTHEALLWTDERFPQCRQCKDGVIFSFVREPYVSEAVQHITADPDFR